MDVAVEEEYGGSKATTTLSASAGHFVRFAQSGAEVLMLLAGLQMRQEKDFFGFLSMMK
jgi:hypothetical protein